ncbi:NK-tumor recognition protein isoform X1 [Gallus gallus]|uniref:NK-tumor recognition protein isoform X1 n=1 Tax=Gallus gallus TaxID=9031 RepID=UPI001AE80CF1|nr:NK-tumor recognition protein isoform X1 [Gallus gallus]XP_046767755.1 NK-tumor recognition protein isoform X1 [Gallus gallus]
MGVQDRPQCFFDIEINREPVGRIMFQLFSDICPKTCKNFLCLCSGEKGIGKTTGKKLCYKGTTFHRVVKNFMIQGGDFSEGNGKGGESIYGGYFKDENFILKHDRAFLLSMANRGKHTNGSQFFITTKPAPHLDGVHVVFGLVISGFEVIEQIENLKTDTASRPYADVRVIDCGVLVTKPAKDALEKKKKVCSDSEASDSSSSGSDPSETSSESEAEDERSRRRKRKRRAKTKQSRKRRKEERKKEDLRSKRASNQRCSLSDKSDVTEKAVDVSTKRDKPVVRPEEIPPVPENRFLLRRDVPVVSTEPEPKLLDATPVLTDQKPSVSKSGRKIKGRGTIRYHTPPRSRSCSESDDDESSETPPHWKEEMQRLRTYRPPSGEKWSKGDKLSDPCTSRWDERSASRRSRSWSHNGYSDLSTVRYSSHHKKHRKKKVKHKKKSKKQKHYKKHKQAKKKKASASSEVESSRSFRKKKSSCDRERKSRSSSLSSRRSSRRDWSKSDKEDQSSSTFSSRESRSYYRSRSRSRSKSRSYSQRSSRSRSASKSSRSRSRSRSSSNPRHQKTVSNSPRNISTRLNENKLNKPADPVRAVILPSDKVVIPPVVPESLPVIPLSDSPPPSRWKPGQKPWKPSYERIQEMKAKATHLIPPQTNYNLVVIKEANTSSYQKQQGSSDSDRSGYSKYRSDKSSDSWQRSRSRSSRSRSYSRSYTRSRSLSSSRTKSRSSGRSPSLNKYRSDRSGFSESTSYFSLSDDDRHRSKRKSTSGDQNTRSLKVRQETSSESTLPYKGTKDYDESSQGVKESDSLSSSDFSTDSEHSGKAKGAQEKEGHFQLEGDAQQQDKNTFHSVRGEEKSKREWDADHSKKKAVKEQSSEQPRGGAKSKQKSYSCSKWDSESNSERGEVHRGRGDSKPLSDKEEGEATSGSDTELSVTKRRKTKSNSSEGVLDSDSAWKISKQLSSSESESSHSNSTHTRGKSKKHKHESKKTPKKSHSKKAKEKSKGKKEKKHKVQKRKEVFHWQPPLEFGEEDEEDINEKPVIKDDKEKQLTRGVKDKQQQACEKDETVKDKTGNGEKPSADENLLVKNTTPDASPNQNKLNKDSINPNTSTSILNSGINVTTCNNETKHAEESNQNGLDVIQTDDNMEICTPDRNSPGKVVVDTLSPVILTDKPQSLGASINKDLQTSEQDAVKLGNNLVDFINIKEEIGRQENNSVPASSAKDSSLKNEIAENTQSNSIDNKWKPLQGVGNLQPATVSTATEVKNVASAPEAKPAGLRIEIKAKNKVRPGSLFDEVRKTARLNRRPRNQESSSEEESPSRDDNSPSRSHSRSRSKSESKSRHRTRSESYSHSRSRSRSSTYSYRSRSYTRSRSRGWYSRDRSRSRSSSYHSYKSRSRTYSRSRSRSSSYGHHSRSSRSYTYDSYYSRSRSRRSDSYRRSRSYDRRSRSYGSDSESDRSYSNNRSPSESSRYS